VRELNEQVIHSFLLVGSCWLNMLFL
jgi:hypothetical protein